MALTKQDLEQLARPFPTNAHKFDYDGNVYLHEEPIAERLDSVDPSWSFIVKDVSTRSNAGEGGRDVGTVIAIVSVTVCDVTREDVGMAIIQKTKVGTSEANQAEKNAITDALKRVARKFGIGRYLLTIPKNGSKSIVSDSRTLDAWLKKTYGDLPTGAEYHEDSLEIDDYLSNEDKPKSMQQSNDAVAPNGLVYTDEIELIEARVNASKKRYYIAGGCTFFSRDAFRDLGFSEATLEGMENNAKTMVMLSEKFRIAYTTNDKGYKTPVKIHRVSTNQTVEVKEKK